MQATTSVWQASWPGYRVAKTIANNRWYANIIDLSEDILNAHIIQGNVGEEGLLRQALASRGAPADLEWKETKLVDNF